MEYPKKFKLGHHLEWKEHRSGWAYAVGCLRPLFCEDGIHLNTLVENKFSFEGPGSPYQEPWVGFLHSPPGIPEWHQYDCSPQMIFQKDAWKKSLPFCRGLIVFSKWMARWVEERLGNPVLGAVHPTETPELKFSMDLFLENAERKLIQVGWWLRRIHSIYELPAKRLRKAFLNPMFPESQRYLEEAIVREKRCLRLPDFDARSVEILPRCANDGYDRLLSCNIVFLHLYDTVVNNTVIECIVRNTPVLVNPLPSVVEYLGEDYPLYFDSLEEAAKKADDFGCVAEAHEYLKALPKDAYSGKSFLKSIAESDLYRKL